MSSNFIKTMFPLGLNMNLPSFRNVTVEDRTLDIMHDGKTLFHLEQQFCVTSNCDIGQIYSAHGWHFSAYFCILFCILNLALTACPLAGWVGSAATLVEWSALPSGCYERVMSRIFSVLHYRSSWCGSVSPVDPSKRLTRSIVCPGVDTSWRI